MTKLVLLSNEHEPIVGRRCKQPKLRVISNEGIMNDSETDQRSPAASRADDFYRASKVLEAQLQGENWFLGQVRRQMLTRNPGITYAALFSKSGADFSNTGRDNLLNVVQFLFLLEALDCTEPEQIGAFIDGHNLKVHADLKSDNYVGAKSELKRAIFSKARKVQIIDTFAHYQRPVFARFELACLLIGLMSTRTSENVIKDLIKGGLMRERGGDDEDTPIGADSSRQLFEPTEQLIRDYVKSLNVTQKLILQTTR